MPDRFAMTNNFEDLPTYDDEEYLAQITTDALEHLKLTGGQWWTRRGNIVSHNGQSPEKSNVSDYCVYIDATNESKEWSRSVLLLQTYRM